MSEFAYASTKLSADPKRRLPWQRFGLIDVFILMAAISAALAVLARVVQDGVAYRWEFLLLSMWCLSVVASPLAAIGVFGSQCWFRHRDIEMSGGELAWLSQSIVWVLWVLYGLVLCLTTWLGISDPLLTLVAVLLTGISLVVFVVTVCTSLYVLLDWCFWHRKARVPCVWTDLVGCFASLSLPMCWASTAWLIFL